LNWKKSLGKAVGDVKGKIDDAAENRRQTNAENERIKAEEEKEYLEYANKVTDLLDKFEISNFDSFLQRYLNVDKKDNIIEIEDKKTDSVYTRPMSRKEYVEDIFRFLNSKEISFDHLKDFALKAKVVAPSFFGIESKEVGNERDFENIINSIKADFQPENIKDEKELQSQLTIFIKAKFPELKIEREVLAKSGDKLDILIDNNYVLELKVPKNKTHLRNLSAQLEEYAEEYPNLCAIIADISNEVSISNDGTELEARLTENILEYSDRYLRKYKVPSIILNVGMRR
jgi:hypothetical protein